MYSHRTTVLLILSISCLSARAGSSERALQVIATHTEAFAEARSLAGEKHIEAAELALVRLNQSKPGTFAWRVESARRLIELAGTLDESSGIKAALAKRVLDLLIQFDKAGDDKRLRVSAHIMAAFVYERYLGDPDSARQNFDAALLLVPDGAEASEGLNRLDATESNLRKRIQSAR